MTVAIDAQTPVERPVRMLYPFAEAAAWLKVSPRLIRVLVDEGRLHSVHIGRLHRIPHAALIEYVESLRKESR